MKALFAAALAASASLTLAACGEPEVDQSEVDPTFDGEGDMSSAAGAGATTGAMDANEDGMTAGEIAPDAGDDVLSDPAMEETAPAR